MYFLQTSAPTLSASNPYILVAVGAVAVAAVLLVIVVILVNDRRKKKR